jgi:hypothetical protein
LGGSDRRGQRRKEKFREVGHTLPREQDADCTHGGSAVKRAARQKEKNFCAAVHPARKNRKMRYTLQLFAEKLRIVAQRVSGKTVTRLEIDLLPFMENIFHAGALTAPAYSLTRSASAAARGGCPNK